MGIELMTSSLPRMRSTPELHRLFISFPSGKRGSNSRPSAWKADALPTELLPLEKKSARNNHSQIFWWEVVDSNHRTLRERIYSPPQLPLCEPPSVFSFRADRGIRTHDPEITNHVLWPTELYRQAHSDPSIAKGIAKVEFFSESAKLFALFFQFFDGKPIVRAAEASPVPETVNVATPGAPSL